MQQARSGVAGRAGDDDAHQAPGPRGARVPARLPSRERIASTAAASAACIAGRWAAPLREGSVSAFDRGRNGLDVLLVDGTAVRLYPRPPDRERNN